MLFGFLKPKPKYPTVDRRREGRFPAVDEFILEFKANASHYIGNSRDISLSGIRFATTCKLKKKSEIVLNFRFPGAFPGRKHVSVPAVVARIYRPLGTSRYRVGCMLHHESDESKEVFYQFIHWLETKA